MSRRGITAAAGLGLGCVLDAYLGDPQRWHPVAGFGRVALALEQVTYEDSRRHGAIHTLALVSATTALGLVIQRATRHPFAQVVMTAAATWVVLGGQSLAREADAVAAHLSSGDLRGARAQVSHLVSRDPDTLDADAVARATCESVAENTSDAVVAPLFWGAVAGIPGLLAYRAINTLDAMIGYRNARYARFGWLGAKLDDAANWLPARLTASLIVVVTPQAARRADAVRAVVKHSGRHPSPNGGVVEAACAGALGLRLGGTNTYGDIVEDRGHLGFGHPPSSTDIARTTRLARRVGVAAAAVAAVGALVFRR